MKKITVFTGATASGKTALALEYAKNHNAEIVCMDSMQVYTSFPVLNASPTREEYATCPHHLFEFVAPTDNFSVGVYSKLAKRVIDDILSRGKEPVLVGGTGLYLNSILYMNLTTVPHDENLRESLEKETTEELYDKLIKIDPLTNIHQNDRKRIIRAIEIYELSGKTKTQVDIENRTRSEYQAVIYAKNFERAELYDRINMRTKAIIDGGAIEEVERLIGMGVTEKNTASGAIGFGEIKCYIEGAMTYDEMLESVSQATRNYAKRQLTWFNANKEIIWI